MSVCVRVRLCADLIDDIFIRNKTDSGKLTAALFGTEYKY